MSHPIPTSEEVEADRPGATQPSVPPAVALEDVSKRYGAGTVAVDALTGVTLHRVGGRVPLRRRPRAAPGKARSSTSSLHWNPSAGRVIVAGYGS